MTSDNLDMPVIVGHEGHLDAQRWTLKNDVTLGRDKNCDIPIPNRQVSRHHAKISLSEEGVILEDLGSKNGTHCNGKRVSEPTLLTDGDVIHIALAQKFIYLSSDATLPLKVKDTGQATPFRRGRLLLEKRSRRVWVQDEELLPPLSASQFHLLEILYKNKGRVVPREELMTAIWGEEGAVEISSQALDALVRRLRNRLAEIDPEHAYIVTLRGHGLKIDNPPQE